MSGGYGNQLRNLVFLKRNHILKLLLTFLYPPMPTLNSIDKKTLKKIKKKNI